MANKQTQQPEINLPVWMNKGEPLTLAHASKTWWSRVYDWLTFPLAQIDVDTCDEQLLDLLAYQRDITRFPGESLSLYRLRVKHAFINSQDAGSVKGFERIFERLDIGKIQQLERQLQYDWDVIVIRINDEQLSRGNDLMMRLVRQYGRTCRRYFFDVLNHATVYTHPGHFDCTTYYDRAKLALRPTAIIPDKTELWLLPGEEKTVHVQVLPEGVEDASFTATVDNAQCATLTHEDSTLTVKGLNFGQVTITLTTTVGGQTATITARVVSGAKVDIVFSSYSSPAFYIPATAESDLNPAWVDWGDGEVGQNYKLLALGTRGGYTAIDGQLTVGQTYTVTIYNSDTVAFGSAGVTNVQNRVVKLHQVAGQRTSLSYFLHDQKELTEIAENAFVYLNTSTLKDISYLLYHCKKVTRLPEGFLIGSVDIENAEGAFGGCGLTQLPKGFLKFASKLKNANYMLGSNPLTEIDSGMLGACAENLENISQILNNCNQLKTDINQIFNGKSYPKLIWLSTAFSGANKLTGEGMNFIAKVPNAKFTASTFKNCTSLSDYNEIPSSWKQ